MKDNITLVAVYGTLKKGFSNHGLLRDSVLKHKGITNNTFDMKSLGGFPSIIPGKHPIEVEVYEVNDKTLERLDQLEGYPYFYNRKRVQVHSDDGDMSTPYIYFVNDPHTISNRPNVQPNNDGVISWS